MVGVVGGAGFSVDSGLVGVLVCGPFSSSVGSVFFGDVVDGTSAVEVAIVCGGADVVVFDSVVVFVVVDGGPGCCCGVGDGPPLLLAFVPPVPLFFFKVLTDTGLPIAIPNPVIGFDCGFVCGRG